MKIIFVGLHHKPGMEALDSRTQSGKMIDEIITLFPECLCYKTNLFPQDRHPTKEEISEAVNAWRPTKNAIHVLLGKPVQAYLKDAPNAVHLDHPGYAMRQGKAKDYPAMSALAILSKINRMQTV